MKKIIFCLWEGIGFMSPKQKIMIPHSLNYFIRRWLIIMKNIQLSYCQGHHEKVKSRGGFNIEI